jgi:hypothetical protein
MGGRVLDDHRMHRIGLGSTDRLVRSLTSRNDGMWRSLVAHLLWEQGVGGSNPLIPTTLSWYGVSVKADR